MRLTQKQENFTLDLFKEFSGADAYRNNYNTANMSLNAIYVEACRLSQNPKVALRLSELRQKAEDASVATVLERKQVLTEMIRARQTDFMTCSADGVWMHDIGEETLNKAGLKKIRTTTMPFGDKDSELKIILTEVELVDPIRAIELLSKHDGALAPEKHEHLAVILTGELTDDELLAIATRHKPGRGGNGASEEAEG